jgi:hypothetical protein
LGQHPAWFASCFMRLTLAVRDHVFGQARGQQTAWHAFLPKGHWQIDHRGVPIRLLESGHQGQCPGLSVRVARHGDTFADTTEVPRLMGVDLAQALETPRAQVTHDHITGPKMGDDRQGPALVRRRAIAEGHLSEGMVHHIRDQIDVHRRAAGATAGAFPGLSQLCMEAALGAVCKQHPTTRRQRPERESCADGLKVLTQSPLAPLLHRGHRVGVESLVQSLWGPLRLRMELDQDVTETFEGDRGVFDHFRRHQLDEILAAHFAARSWDKIGLTRQGFSMSGIEHRGAFPFDFPGIAFHLLVHLPRDVPVRMCDGHDSHRGDVPMIHEGAASVTYTR